MGRGGAYTPRQQSRRYGQSPRYHGASPNATPRRGRNSAHNTPRRTGRQGGHQDEGPRSVQSSGRRTRNSAAGQHMHLAIIWHNLLLCPKKKGFKVACLQAAQHECMPTKAIDNFGAPTGHAHCSVWMNIHSFAVAVAVRACGASV